MLSDFHFLRPLWLLALLPIVPIVVAALRERDTRRGWEGVIAEHLLPFLQDQTDEKRHAGPHVLLCVSLGLAVLALAGPTWEREPSPFAEDEAALVIALEVTPTMLAQDIQPSRLERAAHKIKELVERRKGAATALIAYAGSAHLVLPLTKDGDLVAQLADELQPDVLPKEGDNPEHAVALAREQLDSAGKPGSVLLLTDGVPPASAAALEKIRDDGGPRVHVLALAAGPEVLPPADSPPAPALDRDNVSAAASAGDGSLVIVTPDDRDVDRLRGIVETQFTPAATGDGVESWRDAGYWLVPILAILLCWWFRPGWTVRWGTPAAAGILLLIAAGALRSQTTDDLPSQSWFVSLWQTRDQHAQHLFDRGDHAAAARLFTDPLRQGTAWYRAGDFERAAAAFGRDGTLEGRYNRGNALMLLGRYAECIPLYEQCVEKRPDWEEARANLEIARARLASLAPPEDDAGGTGGKLEADEIVFDDRAKNSSSRQEIEVAGQGDQLSDAEVRATWLRQVETRPADFLRSKFAFQYARRQREANE